MSNATTPTVDAIGKMKFEGNIVPSSWYQNIRMENGKVDLAGCLILADIVYWYSPSEVRDEQTGRVLGYKRKFKADRLQRGYEEQGDMLGLTKDQARDAIDRLADAGLIVVTIENGVYMGAGKVWNGVVYLEPVPEAVAEITYRHMQADMGGDRIRPASVKNPSMVGTESETYTETTTGSTHTAEIPETPTPKRQALETLEKEFFKVGGTLAPAVIEKFYLVYDTNPDHPQERMQHAMSILREKRNIFKAIDAYREWRIVPPKQGNYRTPPTTGTSWDNLKPYG